MEINKIYQGNCIEQLGQITKDSVDLVYMDPPFFTQRKHSLTTRDETIKYEFADSWNTLDDYTSMIESCLIECKRILKKSGSIFLHCDKAATHNLRVILDKVFGEKNFQSEIIWSYKRWSNSKKGLLNSHQTIYFYSKTKNFKFNIIYKDYAPTTNIDQILQDRIRTKSGKSVYKTDEHGNVILGKEKKGVPLSDVWEIPYLNPKAKERVGYPTQKPVLLLKQIIEIATDEGDLVVDPFSGSGTTCVAAKSLNRNFIGIDISKDAVKLANKRVEEMIITESALLKKGVDSYRVKTKDELALLQTLGALPVQRNQGIDGFLKEHFEGKPVPVKIQSAKESLKDCMQKLRKSCLRKNYKLKIIVQTVPDNYDIVDKTVKVIKAPELQIKEKMSFPLL